MNFIARQSTGSVLPQSKHTRDIHVAASIISKSRSAGARVKPSHRPSAAELLAGTGSVRLTGLSVQTLSPPDCRESLSTESRALMSLSRPNSSTTSAAPQPKNCPGMPSELWMILFARPADREWSGSTESGCLTVCHDSPQSSRARWQSSGQAGRMKVILWMKVIVVRLGGGEQPFGWSSRILRFCVEIRAQHRHAQIRRVL